MPTYEFTCESCSKTFEVTLTLTQRASTKVNCPSCGACSGESAQNVREVQDHVLEDPGRRTLMGSLYQRGDIWWMNYTDPVTGKRVQQSSEKTSREEAKRLLRIREGRAAAGQPTPPARADKITVRELTAVRARGGGAREIHLGRDASSSAAAPAG